AFACVVPRLCAEQSQGNRVHRILYKSRLFPSEIKDSSQRTRIARTETRPAERGPSLTPRVLFVDSKEGILCRGESSLAVIGTPRNTVIASLNVHENDGGGGGDGGGDGDDDY
ncbi:hypothetical protein X777_08403, partial [Ooceraea biroi]